MNILDILRKERTVSSLQKINYVMLLTERVTS